MKKYSILLLVMILHGCGICPQPVSVEYDNVNKTIQVLSDDYYIRSVTITEYQPKPNSVELIEADKLYIDQYGPRGTSVLSILHQGENYTLRGNNVAKILGQKNLEFEVLLEKFGNKKRKNQSDVAVIAFMNDPSHTKQRYFFKHPCQ